jgi:hypothetical protein
MDAMETGDEPATLAALAAAVAVAPELVAPVLVAGSQSSLVTILPPSNVVDAEEPPRLGLARYCPPLTGCYVTQENLNRHACS